MKKNTIALDRDIKEIKILIEQYKPEIGFFERDQLLPAIIGRLKYLDGNFEHYRLLCDDDNTALNIDASLKQVLNPRAFDLTVGEPGVGKAYLHKIKDMLGTEFLNPIRLLLMYDRQNLALSSADEFVKYLNEINFLFQSIVNTREKIFCYSFRSFVNIKNQNTGDVLVGPPQHISIVLTPFETRLDEIVNIAKTTIQSIETWAEKQQDERKKFVDIILNSTQLNVAKEQSKAATYNLYAQIGVIFFAIVLIFLSQRANLLLEKRELESSLARLVQKQQDCKVEVDNLKKTNIDR